MPGILRKLLILAPGRKSPPRPSGGTNRQSLEATARNGTATNTVRRVAGSGDRVEGRPTEHPHPTSRGCRRSLRLAPPEDSSEKPRAAASPSPRIMPRAEAQIAAPESLANRATGAARNEARIDRIVAASRTVAASKEPARRRAAPRTLALRTLAPRTFAPRTFAPGSPPSPTKTSAPSIKWRRRDFRSAIPAHPIAPDIRRHRR